MKEDSWKNGHRKKWKTSKHKSSMRATLFNMVGLGSLGEGPDSIDSTIAGDTHIKPLVAYCYDLPVRSCAPLHATLNTTKPLQQ